MPLTLRHMKGLNGLLRGSVKAVPNSRGPLTIAQICGGAVILGNENVLAPQQLLRGHDDVISAFAMSNGGDLAATGQRGANSDVVLWDLNNGTPRCRFQEHDREVAALVFSSDDRLLFTASCAKEPKIAVLDTTTHKVVSRFKLELGKPLTTACAAPMPPGARSYTFATAGGEEISLWSCDPYSGKLTQQKVVLGSVRREYSCLLFSPDGAWLYCGTTSSDVVTVNVGRCSVQMVHQICTLGVGAMLLDPNASGNVIVAGGDGSLSSFPAAAAAAAAGNFRELRPFAAVPGPISSLSISADRSGLVMGTKTGSVYRLDRATNQLATISMSQAGALKDVAFAGGLSDAVAVAAEDGSVCVWNLQDFSLQCRVSEGAAGAALSCVLLPDAIISGWADGHIRCHARTRGGALCVPMWIIPGAHTLAHSVGVTAMRLSNAGTFLLSGGAGGEVRVWDMRSRELASHLKIHCEPVTDVAVMGDDKHVAAASVDRSWSLWDAGSEALRAQWRTQAALKGLALSPDKVSVAGVTADRKVVVWDVRGADARSTKMEAHGVEAGCVASDHRGAVFATGGADCTVKLWDWRSGAELAAATLHAAPITKVAFSPDDRVLVTVAADGTVGFWNL